MELRQLSYFEAVARHESFTRAARELHVAQPAVSAQIARLEAELGARLLQRTTRRVAVTAAGQQLLTRARTVLAELDAARAEVAGHAAVLRGRLRIGATRVVGELPLVETIAAFRGRYPGVAVELHGGLVAEMLERLASSELDLVVGPHAHPDEAGFASTVLVGERLVVITADDHDDRRRPIDSLAELAESTFVCLPRHSGLRRLLDRAAAEHGFEPHVAIEASATATMRALVSAGAGVALIARSLAIEPGPPVRVYDLDPPLAHPPICAFRARRSPPPVVPAFLELLTGRDVAGLPRR